MEGTQNGRTWPRRGRMVLSEVCCGDTDVCQVCQSKTKSRSHIFWCPAACACSSCPVIPHSLHLITPTPPVQTVSCHFNPTISCFPYRAHPGNVRTVCSATQLDTIIPEIEKRNCFLDLNHKGKKSCLQTRKPNFYYFIFSPETMKMWQRFNSVVLPNPHPPTLPFRVQFETFAALIILKLHRACSETNYCRDLKKKNYNTIKHRKLRPSDPWKTVCPPQS